MPLPTNKDSINFNVQYSGNDSTSEQLFGFKDTSSGYGMSATAGWSHSFKPRFNNNASLAFSRNISKGTPFFAYKSNIEGELGIAGTDQSPLDYGPPNLSFTNFGSLSDSSASLNRSQTTNFTDTITYVVQRKHNLSFGFGYRKMQQNALSYANSRGAFSFSGLLTSGFDADGQPLAHTGYDFADFLLGFPQSSSLRIGNSNNYFRGWATNVYAQDDFRVMPGLTLNLGIRYEYFSPFTEKYGHLSNLDINPAMTQVALVTPGVAGPFTGAYPSSLINPDPNNFSPRFGFAFRPSQKRSLIFRGGYSIFYSGSSYGQIAAKLAAQPPFATTGSQSTNLDDPLTLENGFPTQPSTITSTWAINKNYKLAYAQTWSFAIQQTLPSNTIVELEYIGTKGTGLGVQMAPNQAVPGSSLNGANATDHRQRLQLPLPDRFRRFDLPRRTGAPHAPLLARHVRRGALHVLQIHRRCLQLHRPRRHRGTEPARSGRRAQPVELRSAQPLLAHLHAVVARGYSRLLAQRLEDQGVFRLDAQRQLSPPIPACRSRLCSAAISPTAKARAQWVNCAPTPPARASTPATLHTSICWLSRFPPPDNMETRASIPSPAFSRLA